MLKLLLLAAALATPAATAPSPAAALPAADAADGRCVVLLGYLGAHGSAEETAASQRMIPYFLGRLSARHPAAALAGIVRRAADEAKAKGLSAQKEGDHCQAVFRTGAGAFIAGVRTAPAKPGDRLDGIVPVAETGR